MEQIGVILHFWILVEHDGVLRIATGQRYLESLFLYCSQLREFTGGFAEKRFDP